MLQKGASFLGKACYDGHTNIVLLLLGNHAEVDLPTDVRYSDTVCTHTVDSYIANCSYLLFDRRFVAPVYSNCMTNGLASYSLMPTPLHAMGDWVQD